MTEVTLKVMHKRLLSGELDIELLQLFFAEIMKSRQWETANYVFKILMERNSKNIPLFSLYIALCLKQGKDEQAMSAVEDMVARVNPDNQLLDAALAVRRKLTSASKKYGQPPNISLCMIVRNEAKNLPGCLNMVKSLVDEIVLVDTGSVDRTRDIARIYGACIYDYPWQQDFSAARNFSIQQASGRWILILDADEVIAREDFPRIRSLSESSISQSHEYAYCIETRNYCHLTNSLGWQANTGRYKQYETGLGWFPSRKVRFFKKDSRFNFHFPVHERVEPSLKEHGVRIIRSDVPVHHYGHLNESINQRKAREYYELGYAKLEQMRNDPHALRELAVQAGQLERWEQSIALWQRLIRTRPDYVEALINLSGAYWQIGEYDKALTYAAKALELGPDQREARFNVAISMMMSGRLDQAVSDLKALILQHPDYLTAHFMLAAACSFKNDDNQARAALLELNKKIARGAMDIAIDDLVAKCLRSDLRSYAQSLERLRSSVRHDGCKESLR